MAIVRVVAAVSQHKILLLSQHEHRGPESTRNRVVNYTREIAKLRKEIDRANEQEEEARMTRYFAYQRIAELQHAARASVGPPAHQITPEQVNNEVLALAAGAEEEDEDG